MEGMDGWMDGGLSGIEGLGGWDFICRYKYHVGT